MTERGSTGVLTLGQVAERVEGRLVGDASIPIAGIAPVEDAGPDRLAFLGSRRYTRFVPGSGAAAFLVADELEDALPDGTSHVAVDDAYAAMRLLLGHFHPPVSWTPTVHPTAVLGRGVELGDGVEIGPYAVLEDEVSVGDGTRIGAHCVLGRGSTVGRDTHLHSHVVLYHETVVGDRVTLHAGVRLGADGFGYTQIDGVHAKIPQVGRCVVEDDVEIGANSAIDRGSLGDTTIGRGSKLDNLVHVAHNVRVGARSLLAAMVGIAGSTRLGQGVFMGGQSGAVNAIEIGDGAKVTVQAGVIGNVGAGETYSGFPARPHRDAMRSYGHLAKLPELAARVKELEAEVDRLANG